MIQYVAVAKHRDGQNLGFRIFEWLQPRIMRLNSEIGVRFVVLGVRAANWPAYRIYVERWKMKALPIKNGDVDVPPPPATGERPEWLSEEAMIHLYYDLVEHNGPFVHGT
jgi:hypothetical protein